VQGLIAARRRLSVQPPDLLGMLLDTRYDDGSPMSDTQVRDEVATLLVAGHETVANHIAWTFYALAHEPAVEAQLVEEWRELSGDGTDSIESLSSLRYMDAVLAESLRLYPPAWTLARKTVAQDRLPSGLVLRPRDEVLISQYVAHRNAAVFPEPERFDPERWLSDVRPPISAYFPFGTGPRYCIGEPFARLEAAIIMAGIGRRFALRLVPGQRIEKQGLIAMRPRFGLRMQLMARSGTASGRT
jgi:cytochrome P450